MSEPAANPKVDLHQLHKAEYIASRRPVLLAIQPAQYLAIEGKGSPDGDVFGNSVEALYRAAYALKLKHKKRGQDYVIAKLEGLWWSEDESDSFLEQPRELWQWQLLLRLPDFVTTREVQETVEEVLRKNTRLSVKATVGLQQLQEGTCVQMLHVGPYAEETRTLYEMWAFCGENGYRLHGRHHEIYLSNPRQVPPEKMRTILRHPVLRPPE